MKAQALSVTVALLLAGTTAMKAPAEENHVPQEVIQQVLAARAQLEANPPFTDQVVHFEGTFTSFRRMDLERMPEISVAPLDEPLSSRFGVRVATWGQAQLVDFRPHEIDPFHLPYSFAKGVYNVRGLPGGTGFVFTRSESRVAFSEDSLRRLRPIVGTRTPLDLRNLFMSGSGVIVGLTLPEHEPGNRENLPPEARQRLIDAAAPEPVAWTLLDDGRVEMVERFVNPLIRAQGDRPLTGERRMVFALAPEPLVTEVEVVINGRQNHNARIDWKRHDGEWSISAVEFDHPMTVDGEEHLMSTVRFVVHSVEPLPENPIEAFNVEIPPDAQVIDVDRSYAELSQRSRAGGNDAAWAAVTLFAVLVASVSVITVTSIACLKFSRSARKGALSE